MKTFFQNKQKVSSLTTIVVLLMAMVGISYYYLQYDATALNWVMLFSSLFITFGAITTIFRGKYTADCSVLMLGIEFAVYGILTFVGKLLAILNLYTLANIFTTLAIALSTVLLFSVMDKLVFKKSLLSKWWFALVMTVLAVVPSVLGFFIDSKAVVIIKNVAFAILFIAAIVMAIIKIAKKQSLFFCWSYLCYAVSSLAIAILNLLSNSVANKLVCIPAIAIAFIMAGAGAIDYNEPVKKVKKIVHKH